MKRRGWTWVALCIGALLGGAAPRHAGASDFSTGGVFLPLGHGARAQGLGGAGLALLRDDAAAYWNPANLAWIEPRSGVTLMHAELLPEVDNGYDTVSFGRGFGRRLGETIQRLRPTAWGAGAFYSQLGLGFDAGDWSENRLQIAGSWAFSNYASLGASAKVLWLANEFESGNASGAGFDVGLSVLVSERLFGAVVWRDAYTEVVFDNDTRQKLSSGFEAGLEYEAWRALSAEADVHVREGLQRVILGVEWRAWRDVFALRGGLTQVRAGESRTFPSAGAGVHYGRLGLDYGASFDGDDALGIGHRFSLRIGL